MSQIPSAALDTGPTAHDPTPAGILFKDDRPRRIDRVIDYFGDTPAEACGETGLDDLGSEPK